MNNNTDNIKVTGKQISDALLTSLFLVFLNFLILPINIWVSATKRLSKLKESGIISELRKTELIVLNWLMLLFDSLIFLAYVVGLLMTISSIIGIFISIPSPSSRGMMGGAFFGSLILFYFSPIFLSLIKEIISIAIIQVRKIEKIEENTRQTTP